MKKAVKRFFTGFFVVFLVISVFNFRVDATDDAIIASFDFSSLEDGDVVLADYEGGKANALEIFSNAVLKDDNGKSVFSGTGATSFVSSELIPVDPAKNYTLSGNFKSVGSASDPYLYFGFLLFDENKKRIYPVEVERAGNDVTVTSVAGNVLNVTPAVADWNAPTTTISWRYIGVYYDGDTNKRPDYTGMTYVTAEANSINLTSALPSTVVEKIIPGTTVVKNHLSGGSKYTYTAAQRLKVPSSWTEFSGQITGEGFVNEVNVFRLGTRFVEVVVQTNLYGTVNHETLFDDIVLTESGVDNKVIDQIGDSNGYVNGGMSLGQGYAGSGASFDGENDYISIPLSDTLQDMSQGFTWSFWLKGEAQTDVEAKLIDLGDTSIVIGSDTGQKIKAWINTDAQSAAVISDSSVSDDAWHHVALTWDGDNIKLYIDGELQATTANKTGLLHQESFITLGGETGGHFFRGLIDEVKFFNYAASANEIRVLAENPLEVFWELVEEYLFHAGDVRVGGDLKIDGNIVSDGEICIGKCY